jgi:hypothetical protein
MRAWIHKPRPVTLKLDTETRWQPHTPWLRNGYVGESRFVSLGVLESIDGMSCGYLI